MSPASGTQYPTITVKAIDSQVYISNYVLGKKWRRVSSRVRFLESWIRGGEPFVWRQRQYLTKERWNALRWEGCGIWNILVNQVNSPHYAPENMIKSSIYIATHLNIEAVLWGRTSRTEEWSSMRLGYSYYPRNDPTCMLALLEFLVSNK